MNTTTTIYFLRRQFGLLAILALFLVNFAWSQDAVYRCGTEYTNDAIKAQKFGCSALDTANVTIIHGTTVYKNKQKSTSANRNNSVEASIQQRRDRQAKQVLQAELTAAKGKLAQQLLDYNQGQPERWGSEKNYQKYLDRVATMKAGIERSQEDIKSLESEIARL